MNYTVDESGLILGLVTVPPAIKEDSFYNKHIANNLVKEYKEARKKYSFGTDSISNELYNPIGFKTFGNNDLMFYTLFDDFAYPNRVFHPFHGNGDTGYNNFEYQLVVGLNAFSAESKIDDNSLVKSFEKDGLDSYIFTCATRFKINPVFLCGTGLDCIELVKNAVREMHDDFDGKVILLNGVGCDELMMLDFSNDICSIAKIIYRVRNIQFKRLKENDRYGLYEKVRSECVASQIKNITLEEAHVFTSSYSLSGYALASRKHKLPSGLASTGFSLKFTWHVKPGHIGSFTQNLQTELQTLGLPVQKDELFVNKSIVNYSIDGAEVATTSRLIETIDALRGIDLEKKDIRKLHVMVSVLDDEKYLIMNEAGRFLHVEPFAPQKHVSTRNVFIDCLFSSEDMAELRKVLDKSRISKVLKERIMKMYQNFNDCVQDPQFVVSFLGLRTFLQHIIKAVTQYTEGTLDVSANYIHEWLDNCVRDFEQAYLNRFHQSNRMRTLSDFNLEWNGGIQQLICSMDFSYKALMKSCGVTTPYAFMYVSGHERVHVNDHAYRINMQHITYPELFASTLWKEFFNFVPMLVGIRDDNKKLPFSTMMDDRFVTALRERISTHIKFNGSNPTHRIFLGHIDKEFRTFMIADLMAFYIGYNGSFDDFTFWYIRYLLQTPGSYDRAGNISRENFLIFFCRIILVHQLAGATEGELEELRLNAPDPSIASLWMESFSDALELTSLLKDILVPFRFVETVKDMVTTMLTNMFSIPDVFKKAGLPLEKLYNAICEMRGGLFDKYVDSFVSSEINTGINETELVSCMLPGFLKYLRGIITEDGKPCMALTRNEDGHPAVDDKTEEYYCRLLADPLGGSFSIGIDMHKRYFKARSVSYLYLFHFCHCNVCSYKTSSK